MKLFGLIGYPLSHSFSKKYFAQKFEKEGISDCYYDLFPIPNVEDFLQLFKAKTNLVGLNVTIPYKQEVIPFLDELDEGAAAIGAVNTIKNQGGRLIGFNTDVHGFEQSILPIINKKYDKTKKLKALVLGTGGASKAVVYVLEKHGIETILVSRTPKANQFSYTDLSKEVIESYQVIVNTTPLGTAPNVDALPNIPYQFLTSEHFLYDLVYNPEVTAFLQKGLDKNTTIKNGFEMLELQAEKAWDIWQ
ncbi:MAG: shikimate dehydrogenase [Saprospiraceae bacterium]|jgi:shikimate dehydrogenase